MKQTKEEFLNLYIEDLQKQIWILEISRDILTPLINRTNKKEEIDEIIKMQTQFANQIKGNEQRINFIMKVLNGTINLDDPKAEDKGPTTV